MCFVLRMDQCVLYDNKLVCFVLGSNQGAAASHFVSHANIKMQFLN